MNFFQQPTLPSKGTHEVIEKKHFPWNKGLKGAQVAHNRGKDHLSKEVRQRVTDALKGRKHSVESEAKRLATRKINGVTVSDQQREQLKLKALERWSDPVWVANCSPKGRKMTDEQKKMTSEAAKVRWANTTNRARKTHAFKLFRTPYGIMTLKEAISISNLSEQTIRGRIGRETNGWGKTVQYVTVTLKEDVV
tara:strand:+ start:22 stop:603 length:582 start_codon:yes stop_codon:yes gene_type:complete